MHVKGCQAEAQAIVVITFPYLLKAVIACVPQHGEFDLYKDAIQVQINLVVLRDLPWERPV